MPSPFCSRDSPSPDMGFAAPLSHGCIPIFILPVFIALDFITKLFYSIIRLLGITHFIEYEVSDVSDHVSTRPEFQSSSAKLIREILPVVHFQDLCAEGKAIDDGCSICLHEFEREEEVRQLRNCKHVFHERCLDGWLDCDQQTCPLCRTHLVPPEMGKEFREKLWAAETALYWD